MKERFKATVTVALILLKDDQVLLLRRYNTGWADGQYSLVAGCVEANESITQAMIREAHEEAGIIVQPEWLTMSCVIYSNKLDRLSECVDFFFITRQWRGSIINNEPDKCDDLAFFPLNQLPINFIPHIKEGLLKSLDGIYFAEHGW